MADIYSLAFKVLIYPGKPRDEDDLGLSRIAELETGEPELMYDADGKLSIIDAVRALFKQPYFYRVWILQEVTLAREAILLYGRHTISLDHLRPPSYERSGGGLGHNSSLNRVIDELPDRPSMLNLNRLRPQWFGRSVDQDSNTLSMMMEKILRDSRLLFQEDPQNEILELLDAARECAAADPRDKIFSLYGMISRKERDFFAPDYKETVQQTYTKTAVRLAETRGVMAVLVRAVFPGKMKCLAPWVPDWTVASLPSFQARVMEVNRGLVAKAFVDQTDPYSFETTGYRICSLEGLVSLGLSLDISTPTINERHCATEQHIRKLYTELRPGDTDQGLCCYHLEQQNASGAP